VNGIDIRGVGVGTTLTLLNGRRLALASSGQVADVSLIPMSAIERVEVLTDGASAIYGTDAVGGVVNFVLRDSFDGAETKASYGGVTDGNLRQGNVSQTFGRSWSGGNAVASLDYYSASALEVDDRAYAAPAGPGFLTPVDQRHSALATVSQDIGDRVTFNGDFLYSQRDIKTRGTRVIPIPPGFPFPPGFFDQRLESTNETTQYFVNLGADVEVSESLVGSILASYSDIEVDNDSATSFFNQPPPNANLSTRDTAYSALDITAKLDGDLFELPGGALRFSVGVGLLDEEYVSDRTFNNSGGQNGLSGKGLGRATTYAFGEVFAPIVGAGQDIPLIHRLEVSVAARYTDYQDESEPALKQDFGSDTVPKVGLLWSPVQGLNLRGTYGESFRAPTMAELDPSLGFTQLLPPGFTGLNANAVILQGVSPDLDVETSESWTAGFDFRPSGADGPYFIATYFNIDYKDRIALPPASEVQLNPAAFSDIAFHPTSAAQVEQLLRENLPIPPVQNVLGIDTTDLTAAANTLFAMPGLWIVDFRSRNYADTQLDGFDISVGDHFDTGIGRFEVGAEVTRILEFKEQASPASPLTTGTDVPGNPADFRGRFFVTYTNGGLLTSLNVNYVDDYKNPLPTGSVKVDDWTTVDWTTSYEFGGETGLLPGFELTLGIQNVFDEDPPFVGQNPTVVGFGSTYGFDPANADPLGRVVVFGISKTW
jgi:outer membrane receptor protein involved in Fe transport